MCLDWNGAFVSFVFPNDTSFWGTPLKVIFEESSRQVGNGEVGPDPDPISVCVHVFIQLKDLLKCAHTSDLAYSPGDPSKSSCISDVKNL